MFAFTFLIFIVFRMFIATVFRNTPRILYHFVNFFELTLSTRKKFGYSTWSGQAGSASRAESLATARTYLPKLLPLQ